MAFQYDLSDMTSLILTSLYFVSDSSNMTRKFGSCTQISPNPQQSPPNFLSNINWISREIILPTIKSRQSLRGISISCSYQLPLLIMPGILSFSESAENNFRSSETPCVSPSSSSFFFLFGSNGQTAEARVRSFAQEDVDIHILKADGTRRKVCARLSLARHLPLSLVLALPLSLSLARSLAPLSSRVAHSARGERWEQLLPDVAPGACHQVPI